MTTTDWLLIDESIGKTYATQSAKTGHDVLYSRLVFFPGWSFRGWVITYCPYCQMWTQNLYRCQVT